MTATTINSFPAMHSFTSPRGWALAIIVVVHLGFFWALSNGLSISIIDKVFHPEAPDLIPIIEKPVPPPPKRLDIEVKPEPVKLTYVPPVVQIDDFEESRDPPVVSEPPPTSEFPPEAGGVSQPQSVVMEPRIDPRRGISEPLYPPQAIRAGHEGSVLLSVYILANGRVGEVKLDKTSGYPKLDESALREARLWRFQPGTRDGVPVAMWKQVPVTFRLNNNN